MSLKLVNSIPLYRHKWVKTKIPNLFSLPAKMRGLNWQMKLKVALGLTQLSLIMWNYFSYCFKQKDSGQKGDRQLTGGIHEADLRGKTEMRINDLYHLCELFSKLPSIRILELLEGAKESKISFSVLLCTLYNLNLSFSSPLMLLHKHTCILACMHDICL